MWLMPQREDWPRGLWIPGGLSDPLHEADTRRDEPRYACAAIVLSNAVSPSIVRPCGA